MNLRPLGSVSGFQYVGSNLADVLEAVRYRSYFAELTTSGIKFTASDATPIPRVLAGRVLAVGDWLVKADLKSCGVVASDDLHVWSDSRVIEHFEILPQNGEVA